MEIKRKFVDSIIVSEDKKTKTDNTLQSDFIKYISVPSLESIAIVNIVTILCKQSDIIDALRLNSLKFDPMGLPYDRNIFYDHSFTEIASNILNKINLLPLPKLLKGEASNCIEHIMSQILTWIRHNEKETDYIDFICCTNEGTIDKIKTLKQLIENNTGECIQRYYELACMYCSEESIHNLWNKLPDTIKEDYLYDGRIYREYNDHFIAYWTHAVNNQLSMLLRKIMPNDNKIIYRRRHSLNHNMFKLALIEGNSLAVKYFWNKLSLAEISDNLKQWVNRAVYSKKNIKHGSDILWFLLTKMDDKEQQGEILQKHSELVLNSLFTYWPWQRFLLPTIKGMWSFLDENIYAKFLNGIAKQIKVGKTTQKIFNRLWNDSPVNFKRYYIQFIVKDVFWSTEVFRKLLIVKDIGTIKEVLDYAHVEEQVKIISALIEDENFNEFIREDRLPHLDILINMLYESDTKDIKKRIVLKNTYLLYTWVCDNNLVMVDKFLNWAFSSQDEIIDYKNTKVNKIQFTYNLIHDKRDYEVVNKFMSWCFDSEEKINQFKRCFAKSKPFIVTLGFNDWCSFEKFLDWCFDSEQEINDFKLEVLESHTLRSIVLNIIACSYNFEFIDRLLSWCYHTSEEIKQYKTRFVLTEEFILILQNFVSNYSALSSELNNWELIKKLMKFFYPLEKDIITKLKEKIETCIDFKEFNWYSGNSYFKIEKKDLFNLLDNDSYNIGDDECSSE